MQNASPAQITNIRAASRDLVRELGFMNRTLAGTALSPSAVHAIIEIGEAGRLSSKALSELLLLEKSTVSRLVKSLKDKRVVRHAQSPHDARSKDLYLTAKGRKAAAAITQFAEQQVASATKPLSDKRRREILNGLDTYAAALKSSRMGGDFIKSPVVISRGYAPGLIGRIVEIHAVYYSKHSGFGAAFESTVASGLADMVTRLDKPMNALWRAEMNGRIVGGIAIDGEDLGGGQAHLRTFILDEEARGTGAGKALMKKAMAFCDERAFCETVLWTFKGLDAARNLYERHGFVLKDEYFGDQWGVRVLEQKFMRPCSATIGRR